MPYLLPTDFDTHIYAENRSEITRGDDNLVAEILAAAIDEVKSYLTRFDLVKIFGTNTVNPVYTNINLKQKVKDVALWHLATLAQTNIKMEVARTKYEDAIRFFEKVASRAINPAYPMPNDNDQTPDSDESQSVEWDSNPKRNNHY